MVEIWKDIKGHEGFYQVSNIGKIKSLPFKYSPKTKILNPYLLKIGYYQVNLRGEKHYVHRLVALLFIDNPENKPEVNHKNGVKYDNNVSNLEWVTKSEQLIHSHRFLNRKVPDFRGVKSPNSKLNELQVRVIRKMKPDFTLKEIGGMFNINIASISRVQNNRSYKL